LVLVVRGLVELLTSPSVTFFAAGGAYVASGPLEALWRWRTGRTLERPTPEPVLAPEGAGGAAHD
jgi:hypothetical protein